eukprot:CAMPEP_0197620716 /NCGR_PEP_ID=MMETSP1338-20131121/1497_1 /TAXON_ID=43686 ORGANISM="Pelagodinium beii, Strain RCC1491" /NCGR_SAMPLE_ID=MMETSP1338 /ASSEMBLY_ACC=CAM_ASM_000754 /LENGTH=93 /DNA_ID=CAMNT_0043189985 /DNA_START=90 /DNA_END=371 /DNA_ORIENTATION=+
MGAGFDQYNAWSGFACNMDDAGNCAKGAWMGGLTINLAGIGAIAAWVAFWSALVFVPLKAAKMLRASDDLQEEGFDARKHSPPKAYVVTDTKA